MKAFTSPRQWLAASLALLMLIGIGIAIGSASGQTGDSMEGASAPASPASSGSSAPASAGTPSAGLGKSSLSIPLYNNSSYNMVLTSVTGDNAGVPSAGSALLAGEGYQDYEVVFRAAKTTTVTANFDFNDPSGNTQGTGTVKLSVDAMASRSVSSSYSSDLALKTSYVGNGAWEVEDSAHTTHTIDATDAQAPTLVQQFCNDADNSASCSFKASAKTSATQGKLLVSGYNQPGGDGQPATISMKSGYESETSVTTGTAVSASLKLGGILTLGIKESQDEELAFSQIFTSSQELPVDPGDTGYIWGQVPVIQYTGTMTVDVGNTTWTINNFTVTSPDTHGSLTGLKTATYHGQYPIGKPDQPPA